MDRTPASVMSWRAHDHQAEDVQPSK